MIVRRFRDGAIAIGSTFWWLWCKPDHVDQVSPATSHVFPIWLPLSLLAGLLAWFVWVESQTEEE